VDDIAFPEGGFDYEAGHASTNVDIAEAVQPARKVLKVGHLVVGDRFDDDELERWLTFRRIGFVATRYHDTQE
jgi:hypothetical protein